MEYRKKPVEVEAWQWGGKWLDECKDAPQWVWDALENGDLEDYSTSEHNGMIIEIETLEGTHIVRPRDYIIKGVKGELYPCKPDIFEMTYEEINE